MYYWSIVSTLGKTLNIKTLWFKFFRILSQFSTIKVNCFLQNLMTSMRLFSLKKGFTTLDMKLTSKFILKWDSQEKLSSVNSKHPMTRDAFSYTRRLLLAKDILSESKIGESLKQIIQNYMHILKDKLFLTTSIKLEDLFCNLSMLISSIMISELITHRFCALEITISMRCKTLLTLKLRKIFVINNL